MIKEADYTTIANEIDASKVRAFTKSNATIDDLINFIALSRESSLEGTFRYNLHHEQLHMRFGGHTRHTL